MKSQKNMFQIKEQGENPKQTKISHLPDKEFKERVLRTLTGLGSGAEKLRRTCRKSQNARQSRADPSTQGRTGQHAAGHEVD